MPKRLSEMNSHEVAEAASSMEALRAVFAALEPLDDEKRSRVLACAAAFYGVDVHPVDVHHVAAGAVRALEAPARSIGEASARALGRQTSGARGRVDVVRKRGRKR